MPSERCTELWGELSRACENLGVHGPAARKHLPKFCESYFILFFSLLYLKHLQLSLYMGAGEVGDIRCCRFCWALDCMRRLLLPVARGKDSTWEIGFLYPGLP